MRGKDAVDSCLLHPLLELVHMAFAYLRALLLEQLYELDVSLLALFVLKQSLS